MLRHTPHENAAFEMSDDDWLRLLKQARTIFGDRLTSVILTGRGHPMLEIPSFNANLDDRIALATALDIAKGLLDLEGKATVQAWFVGMNPMLQDRSPAVVVRSEPDLVREAALQFAAYG
jgi:hypothetical protein